MHALSSKYFPRHTNFKSLQRAMWIIGCNSKLTLLWVMKEDGGEIIPRVGLFEINMGLRHTNPLLVGQQIHRNDLFFSVPLLLVSVLSLASVTCSKSNKIEDHG